MRRLDHVGNEGLGGIGDVDDVHLRPRHHHVAGLEFGHLEGALDDREGIGVEELALVGGVEQLDELFAVFGLAHEECAEPFEE